MGCGGGCAGGFRMCEVMSNIQGLLDAMRDRPETFEANIHTFKDTKSGAEYWVCNGFWFYGMYRPSEYSFNFVDKWRFDRALKRWRAGYLHYLNSKAKE
jgi:hypothetical protein